LPDIDKVIEGCYQDPLALRDVRIDDILGRTLAAISTVACQRILADKVVLVTGAAGSIGSELCRQVLGFKPRVLLALDNNETGLYELNLELNRDGRSPVQLIIADVTDWHKMNRVFQQHKPQVIFHAAAYKHVPLVECHPDEALRVNVMGTAIVSEVAHEFKAERFVFISTDKAVNPSSVMGASKRIGELWMKAMSERSGTIFATVRFGNVIGSRGSVLPTFRRQIEMGGPVTVTHPDMHRFFISIPEAVSLVLQAATFSQGGKVFMLDMGEEVPILKLAERMIRLRGLRVKRDIEIKYTGARPGEKLHEELAYYNEPRSKTSHPRIYSLECPDGLVDHDTLLGVISILRDCLRLPGGDQHVRTGIFQVASGDIDGFLNDVTGLDLTRGHQLPDRADTRKSGDKVVSSARPGQVAERTAAQFRGMSPPQLAKQTQSA
jgi:FlaA1/EpsC-like NDP-sugar epimerase